MIPLVLATGFLGSGKTSFLRGVAQRECTRHLVFLVNEFSPLDVDGAVVAE
ncbi:MAG: GTP-binding protein, partial [Victivallales bacterium]|nr:GTP-binding protein [Victivallales bacterium]